MLKQYKLTLILTSLATLLPIPVGLLLNRGWGCALLPLILLLVHWFCIFWTAKDPGSKKQSKKPLLLIFWTVPVISCFSSFVNYALMSGLEFSISSVYCLVFGMLFAAIGNYLPKVKMNSTLGIKIPWTYSSEANWTATHRFGGKIWFLCGLILLAASFLPQAWGIGVMLTAIAAACIIPTVYSYLYYRRQKAQGDTLLPLTFGSKGTAKTSYIFLAALAVFICVILFTGNIEYQFTDNSLLIDADYHDDLVLDYDAITSMEFREENVPGVRAWGFGSLRLLMGTFQNEEFGNYIRYTYYSPESALVLTTENQTIVLSGETPVQTG